jgi:nicotinamide riboside transporter PnuC
MIDYLHIPLGLALLFFGRKLFWLFVAGVGFLVGYTLAPYLPGDLTSTGAAVVGLVCGIIGALLALFAQKVAIVAGGFLAGGYATITLLSQTGVVSGLSDWVLFILGGIAGALLLKFVFEWSLIALTSIIGAGLVFQPFGLNPTLQTILTIVLAVLGFVVQARTKQKK